MTKPIKPADVAKAKIAAIPEIVIEIANELIALHYCNGRSQFNLSDFKSRLHYALLDGYKQEYLDIEDIYREQGWKVTFHKPDYTEDWDSYYEFRG